MTTPSEVITALEKSLEAGPTPGPWRAEDATHKDDDGYPETPIVSPEWSAYVAVAIDFGRNNPTMRDTNANFIAAANPLAIRTLLDAHASALRDAERLRNALLAMMEGSRFEDGHWGSIRMPSDAAMELARSALDDNTKGAAPELADLGINGSHCGTHGTSGS